MTKAQEEKQKVMCIKSRLTNVATELKNLTAQISALGAQVKDVAGSIGAMSADFTTKLDNMEKFSGTERYLTMNIKSDYISEAASSINDVDFSMVIDESELSQCLDNIDTVIDSLDSFIKM